MKPGSSAMQILAAAEIFLQQPWTVRWGHFFFSSEMWETEEWRREVKSPKIWMEALSLPCPHGSFQTSHPSTFLQGRQFPQGSSVFPIIPIFSFFSITGASAYGQGRIAISEDCVGFALKQWYLHRVPLSLERCVVWLCLRQAGTVFFSLDDFMAECHTPPGKEKCAQDSDSSISPWPLWGLGPPQKDSMPVWEHAFSYVTL